MANVLTNLVQQLADQAAACLAALGVTSDAAELNILDGATFDVTQANNRLTSTANYVLVTDAASYTVLAANSGKTHYLPDFTAACSLLLPAEAAGLDFEFVYAGGALDAHGIILNSESDTNYFTGGVLFTDMDAGAGADESVAVYPDGNSNSKLTATSVGAGTRIRARCIDGTHWQVLGQVCGNTAPTYADQ
jgi:hypothetical protein